MYTGLEEKYANMTVILKVLYHTLVTEYHVDKSYGRYTLSAPEFVRSFQ